MVSLTTVRESNARFQSEPSKVALFVGATSGIGEATLKHFVKNAQAPTVYIVCRSKEAALPQLEMLQKLNSDAAIHLIEAQISLMKEVDRVCEYFQSKEKHLDLLFMSPGYLSFSGRNPSSEGLDIPHALRYYTRLRFLSQLLPSLTASRSPRVVSILAGGKEGPLNFGDLEFAHAFNGFKAAANGATQTSLAFEELAKTHPEVVFVHKFPGLVRTGLVERLMGTAGGVWWVPATLVRYLVVPVLNLFSTSPDVAGERGLYVATSARYPPAIPRDGDIPGVEVPAGMKVAQSSMPNENQRAGNGVYLLDENDETSVAPIMEEYHRDGASRKVWEDTQKVWARALANGNSL